MDSASSLASTTESDILVDGGGKREAKTKKKKLKRETEVEKSVGVLKDRSENVAP